MWNQKVKKQLGFWGRVAIILVLIGAYNIGIMGAAQYNILEGVFKRGDVALMRAVYVLIGVAALWLTYVLTKITNEQKRK